MPGDPLGVHSTTGGARVPPYSEEAEVGVLGSTLLDSARVLDICVESQLVPESFYIPAHRLIFETMLEMSRQGLAVDILTVAERLRAAGKLDSHSSPCRILH